MSKSMAAEFGPDKVRVNCVNPVFSPETALSADFAGGALTEEAKKASSPPSRSGASPRRSMSPTPASTSPPTRPSLVSGVCIEVDGARCV